MVKQILFVGTGGAIGCILRYLTSLLVVRMYGGAFPLATFLVNIVGCFIIGILAGLVSGEIITSPNLKLLFITGFCGGYTTFSTFAMENLNLLHSNHMFVAFSYIILSVMVGIVAVWLGMFLGMAFIK